ncbi:iron complex transport system ATP-binding protein [Sphingomonas kyeonggiensis]|uniref:ABC transporter ATP-binding protein n=1 Tax=Sphingomonas kyeonggiensis TaxID=1268553 RepID=UPI002785AC34|nr:ABC transporter ATP-binding protein [Sphingomonas kyeonggiensis]MDQ0249186.1 iron complex transport system ATP-binding protein [Sphingomonas kyeonggiensis]
MVNIRLENVAVTLGNRIVVQNASTAFAPGTLTGIVGPNGAGKSTLARAMLALVPHKGSILVDDSDVATLPRAELAKRVAYLPQGQTLHWPLTVERLVELGRLPHLAPMSRIGEGDTTAIERAMERADVVSLRDRIATELSGGERARVLLARALAVEAPALIADEPLASLDPGHQIDVMELLQSEARAGGLVIAVLHDLTMAARYCDRLVLIDGGTVVAEGTPAEVLTPANLKSVYGIDARVELTGDWPTITTLGRSR